MCRKSDKKTSSKVSHPQNENITTHLQSHLQKIPLQHTPHQHSLTPKKISYSSRSTTEIRLPHHSGENGTMKNKTAATTRWRPPSVVSQSDKHKSQLLTPQIVERQQNDCQLQETHCQRQFSRDQEEEQKPVCQPQQSCRHHRPRSLLLPAVMSLIVYSLLTARGVTGIRVVEKVNGTTASIPCDIPLTADSKDVLVLWYKSDTPAPVYVFESKEFIEKGTHKIDGGEFSGDRAKFDPLLQPPTLLLEHVQVEDEGIYNCFAFIAGVSYNGAKANLTVIVPPDKPIIIDAKGKKVNISDVTYSEGSTVHLTCQVTGGKPQPSVKWYWDKELLDDTHDTVGTGVVRNDLEFGPLTRNHSNARIVCLASTYKLVTPVNTIFWLNVQFKPTSVTILNEAEPLTAGETYRLQCQSVGASPPAELSWYLDGQRITNETRNKIYNQVTQEGTMSLSTLTFTPEAKDRGKELQCRSRSPVITHDPLRDTRLLQIHYMGSVSLTVQRPREGLVEGASVGLSCVVDSDPPPDRITWQLKQGSMPAHKILGVEGPQLTLTDVSRNQTGVYTCVASSPVGDGHSNTEVLQVNYKPTCKEPGLQMMGTDIGEMVRLACKVNSSPEPTSYRWQLNSGGEILDIPEDKVKMNGLVSILRYIPRIKSDYGKLLCRAVNDIGEQKEPCKFELVSAVRPTPLTNCTASNNDTHTVHIECSGGSENGLPEDYFAEIYDITQDRLLRNMTSKFPSFLIEELDPGSGYKVEAYSSNIRGPSERFTLNAFTEPLVKKSLDLSSIHVFPITPILGILVGIVGAVVIMALVVIVVVKLKTSKRSHDTKLKCGEPAHFVPMDEQDFSRYGKGGGGAKTTLINFPAESTAAPIISEKPKLEEPSASTPLSPNAPTTDVEYAELEFTNEKKLKKKKKKSKKKKEVKDEETEYASIDHVRTLLNSQQQNKEPTDKSTEEQQDDDTSGKAPLVKIEKASPRIPKEQSEDGTGRIVLPDGALESSV